MTSNRANLSTAPVYTIPFGPRFKGFSSSLGFFGTIVSGIACYYYISFGDVLGASTMLLATIISILIFLDFQGITIDFEHQRIKRYKSLAGFKFGRWESLDQFNEVSVHWERIQGNPAASMMTQSRRASSSDSYFVYLQGQGDVIPFEIGEYSSHKTARSVMQKLGSRLNIKTEDHYQKRLDSARRRRQARQ